MAAKDYLSNSISLRDRFFRRHLMSLKNKAICFASFSSILSPERVSFSQAQVWISASMRETVCSGSNILFDKSMSARVWHILIPWLSWFNKRSLTPHPVIFRVLSFVYLASSTKRSPFLRDN